MDIKALKRAQFELEEAKQAKKLMMQRVRDKYDSVIEEKEKVFDELKRNAIEWMEKTGVDSVKIDGDTLTLVSPDLTKPANWVKADSAKFLSEDSYYQKEVVTKEVDYGALREDLASGGVRICNGKLVSSDGEVLSEHAPMKAKQQTIILK